jgi:hypothetical protein
MLAGEPPKAGRELDALVAEKVMGADPSTVHWHLSNATFLVDGKWVDVPPVPHYSTDIAAAWEVVEKMSQKYHWRIQSPFDVGDEWYAGLTPRSVTGWNGRPDHYAGAPSAPLAICLAALKAVGA